MFWRKLFANGNTINLTNGHISNVGANLQNLIGGNPQLTSNGEMTIDGAASTVNAANATINVGTADIQGGTMFLNGLFINNSTIDIWDGARLVSGFANRINGNGAIVNIATGVGIGGNWELGGDETIGTLNSGGLLDGTGLLTDSSGQYFLTDGAVTGANADLGDGTLNSDGAVTMNGRTFGEQVNVRSGQLNLASGGRLADSDVDVFVDDDAILNLGGDENVESIEIEGILSDNGGPSSLLTANDYLLDSGETKTGANLGTGDLRSIGTSVLGGNTNADTIHIDNGSLTTNGDVQNTDGIIRIDSNATWFVNGNFEYDTVHGEGTITPGNNSPNFGRFTNEDVISPGVGGLYGLGDLGALTIDGNYREEGTYLADLGPSMVPLAGSTISPTRIGMSMQPSRVIYSTHSRWNPRAWVTMRSLTDWVSTMTSAIVIASA